MSAIIVFIASLLALPASIGIGLKEPQVCRTEEFITLMYHHVRDYEYLDTAARNISVSPQEFGAQMRFLSDNNYRVITSSEIRNGTVPCNAVMITFDDGYYDVFTEAYPIMKQYSFPGIIGLIPAKIDESDYMTGSQIRLLQNIGWEVANHTWHHPNLSELPREYIPYEIEQSKRDLEKWFDTQIHIFIYPKGRYTYYTLDIIKNSGHLYAFTTQTGKSNLGENTSLELKRIDVIPGMTEESFSQLFKTTSEI